MSQNLISEREIMPRPKNPNPLPFANARSDQQLEAAERAVKSYLESRERPTPAADQKFFRPSKKQLEIDLGMVKESLEAMDKYARNRFKNTDAITHNVLQKERFDLLKLLLKLRLFTIPVDKVIAEEKPSALVEGLKTLIQAGSAENIDPAIEYIQHYLDERVTSKNAEPLKAFLLALKEKIDSRLKKANSNSSISEFYKIVNNCIAAQIKSIDAQYLTEPVGATFPS